MLKINKENEPSLFSEPKFLAVKNKFLATLEDKEQIDYSLFGRFLREIRILLAEESQGRCVYCEQEIGITSYGQVDHFYPRFEYPNRCFDWDNLFLSCQLCNNVKGNFDPCKNGELEILHPAYDDIQSQISTNESGYLVGNSVRAINTIDLFKLNRDQLVAQRKKNNIIMRLSNEGYSSASSILFNNGYYDNFLNNILKLEQLLTIEINDVNQKQLFNHMVYANIITSLETYLSDAFINTVISSQELTKRFVKTFKDFKEVKLELSSIFDYYDVIQDKVTKALLDVIYHNIWKVKGMYKDTLGVEFPNDLSAIRKAILIRHDIVHRNGKDKTGQMNEIQLPDVLELISTTKRLVKHINDQILQIETSSTTV